MHLDPLPATPATPGDVPWYKLLNRYHWFVLFVSALGWLFDTMDQQLFNLARGPAIRELMGPESVQFYGALATTIFMLGWATGGIVFGVMGDRVGRAKTMVFTILIYSLCTGLSSFAFNFESFALFRFLTGLGVGGEFAVGVALVAEVMPEKARPEALGWLQACSAIGNVMAAFISIGLAPFEAAGTLGSVQPWRIMFVIGALPALLALIIRRRLKEPERWVALRASADSGGPQLGSYTELFSHPVYRRNAIIGLIMATAGVVGLWGIGFFSFDLTRSVFREKFTREARTKEVSVSEQDFVRHLINGPDRIETMNNDKTEKPRIVWAKEKIKPAQLLDPNARVLYQVVLAIYQAKKPMNRESILTEIKDGNLTSQEEGSLTLEKIQVDFLAVDGNPANTFATVIGHIGARTQEIEGRLTLWAGLNGLLFNIGAFFGIYAFSRITKFVGRKPAFAVTFLMALLATAFTFWNLKSFGDIFWMVPLMGFFQIALFGGYAIYFPELFPTRLRSTGTSFCYNVGRFLAAAGPLMLGALAKNVFGEYGEVMSWRLAGITMCSFFLVGLAVLPFAPETKGKPLPE